MANKKSHRQDGAMMRAMVLRKTAPIESNPLRMLDVEAPAIKQKNDVVISIDACGVCRSNLHLIEGDWAQHGVPSMLPIIPGHEVVGKIAKAGQGVRNLSVGDRVGVQPLFSSCLDCEYCNSGREHLCETPEITGESVNGGYAEQILAKAEFVTPVPDSIDSLHAAPLFCPGITAYKAVKASEPAKGKSIGVFGVGGVGHLAVEIAKLQGSRVVAISRAKKHLDVAKDVGADSVLSFDSSQDQFLKMLKKEEGLLDAAIVFAPSEQAIGTAIKSIKKGGTVVIGVLGNIPDFNCFEEKVIKGTVIGSRADMKELLAFAVEKNLRVVAERHKLANANKVLSDLKRSQIPARAVLVP